MKSAMILAVLMLATLASAQSAKKECKLSGGTLVKEHGDWFCHPATTPAIAYDHLGSYARVAYPEGYKSDVHVEAVVGGDTYTMDCSPASVCYVDKKISEHFVVTLENGTQLSDLEANELGSKVSSDQRFIPGVFSYRVAGRSIYVPCDRWLCVNGEYQFTVVGQ